MARILPKKSTVAAKVPTTSDLNAGEVSVNWADRKWHGRHPTDNSIVELGGISAIGSWSWATGAYFNLSNGNDNVIRFNTQDFNTNSGVFELINSNTATARIHVKLAGYYEFISQVHLFDLYGNVDVLVKLRRGSTTSDTPTLVSLFSDFKASELTADQLLNSTIIVNVTSAGYYDVAVNPSANGPYPSDTNNTPSRLFIKRLA